MTVLYRAVWSDAVAADIDQKMNEQKALAAAWAQETAEPAPMVDGQCELNISQGRRRKVTYREVAAGTAFEVIASDHKPGDATEWTTLIRVVADEDGVYTLVENRMESDDLTIRISVGRPRVVHELLGAANKPSLGSSALLTEPQPIPADGISILTDVLADAGRTVPVIVCSEPGGRRDDTWLSLADKVASRVEGVALVVTLDEYAVTAFKKQMGELAVWGGGIRVYAPVPVVLGSEGWRHRYYIRSRLEESPQATIDRIVYSVAQLSARRRVPEVFRIFGEQSGRHADASDGLIPVAHLDEAREQWEFDRDLALEERSALEKELSRATGHLARLKNELMSRGLTDLLWGTQHEVGDAIPDEVQDTSEAVLAAQLYLSRWLALPDSAGRELEGIDTAENAYPWGNNAWRGLRALAAYAEDRANGWSKGGFWEWCAEGPLLGWPATSKKLAMSEGETVQDRVKYKRTRIFKVDHAVDKSGEMMMLAHLKIAEGGGNLAPRIYFHDDTGGPTSKIHVGFVGPHYLVPNKSTN